MKLTRLIAKNFRGLRSVEISLDPELTILVGPNSSGKSNILDSIAFLADVANSSPLEAVRLRGGEDIITFAGNFPGLEDIVIKANLRFEPTEIEYLHSLVASAFPLSEFQKIWDPNWSYEVRLGWPQKRDFTLISEEVQTRVRDHLIVYARASWRESPNQMYQVELTADVSSGLRTNHWELRANGEVAGTPTGLFQFVNELDINWTPLQLMRNYFSRTSRLLAVRQSPESTKLLGKNMLATDASDLPQVLHSIASSRRKVFDNIVRDLTSLLPDIDEIRSPMVEGADTTYLAVTEKEWPADQFLWNSVSSGTKEVIYLLTFLYATPEGALLLIEEPEIHLHPQAITKLREILSERAANQNKQLILTTHSTTLIDKMPFEKTIFVSRERGETQILVTGSFSEVEELFSEADVPKSSILVPESRILILVVEGRDDAKVWRQFLKRGGIDTPSHLVKIVPGEKQGGIDEVISALTFLERIGEPVVGFGIVDGSEKSVREKMTASRLNTNNFHILSRGEIEDYLLDAEGISKIVNRPVSEVRKVLAEVKGHGKPKLDSVLKQLGISKVSPEVKELLAIQLGTLDPEVIQIGLKISKILGRK